METEKKMLEADHTIRNAEEVCQFETKEKGITNIRDSKYSGKQRMAGRMTLKPKANTVLCSLVIHTSILHITIIV